MEKNNKQAYYQELFDKLNNMNNMKGAGRLEVDQITPISKVYVTQDGSRVEIFKPDSVKNPILVRFLKKNSAVQIEGTYLLALDEGQKPIGTSWTDWEDKLDDPEAVDKKYDQMFND